MWTAESQSVPMSPPPTLLPSSHYNLTPQLSMPPHRWCRPLRVPPRHRRGGSLRSRYHCTIHDKPSVKVVVRVRPTVSWPVDGTDLWFVRRTAPDSAVAVRCGWRPRRQGLLGRCVRSGGTIVHDRELAELPVLN